MLSQIYMGKSLTFAFQRRMQNVVDNVANASTVGFKKNIMEFESLFPQVMDRVIAEFEDPTVPFEKKTQFYPEFGTAMRISEIIKDMSQGGMKVTNRELDVAIEGKGFFQHQMSDGTVAYSRAGNFKMDHQSVVVDANNHPLEPELRIPDGAIAVQIREDGRVYASFSNQIDPQQIGQINLTYFPNPQHLRGEGQNLYTATPEAGDAVTAVPGTERLGKIRQGSLELSNVDVIEEMVEMLISQRGFEVMIGSINSGSELVKAAQDIPK